MGIDAIWSWALAHLVSLVGLGFAFVLLAGLLRDRRPPGSAMAWFLAIALLPYVGVPLYLLLGQRKVQGEWPEPVRCPGNQDARSNAPASDLEKTITALGVHSVTENNCVRPIALGAEAFGELMAMFADATKSIEVSTFILGHDPVGRAVVEALVDKAKQGVEVRLLLDSLGSMRTRRHFVDALREAGGQVGQFLPVLPLRKRWSAHLRNHRKLVIVDESVAMIGGMNLAQEYMGPDRDRKYWSDFAAIVRGPVVDSIRDLFARDWRFATGEELGADSSAICPCDASETLDEARVQLIASGPNSQGSLMRDALLAALIETRQRIWIVTPYFIPDEPIAGVLTLLARQGKDVCVLVPARSNHRLADWARIPYLQDLRQAGGRVMLYQDGMLHTKLVLVDDLFVSIGSANLDMRSLYLNFEASIFVYSATCVKDVAAHVQGTLLPRCRPLGDPKLGGAWRSAKNDLARLLSPLL